DRFGEIYREEIIPELETAGIFLVHREDYDTYQEEFSKKYFKKISDCIKPVIVEYQEGGDLFLENNQLYFMVTFAYEDNFAVVNIPTEECGRFITFSME
ncbi:polyphosphate kinase 1, partial [Salinimicrobium sp. CDJ15-91]|nr:polyphosphate kinase 1 [Salinimicrobium oceani]